MDQEQGILKEKLKHINYRALPISDYSRGYIMRMLPALDYYWNIFNRGLNHLLAVSGLRAEEVVFVDYGGGHGFLSFLAKSRGFSQVIYIDMNPHSVKTVDVLSDQLGMGPDVILCGMSNTLKDWCVKEQTYPNLIMGTDVIEHIYCLDDFFSDIFSIPGKKHLCFTTASTPYNKMVVRRLHKAMVMDESGVRDVPSFRQLRREFIQKEFPDLSPERVSYWVDNTRGLVYEDIRRAVENDSPNLLRDPFNTCDPRTGSWTERILPIKDYRELVEPYGCELKVAPGFYNGRNWMLRMANRFIARKHSLRVAPFIYLFLSPVKKKAYYEH